MWSTSTKDQIKFYVIIFCVNHNRERTITLELETWKGLGREECEIFFRALF